MITVLRAGSLNLLGLQIRDLPFSSGILSSPTYLKILPRDPIFTQYLPSYKLHRMTDRFVLRGLARRRLTYLPANSGEDKSLASVRDSRLRYAAHLPARSSNALYAPVGKGLVYHGAVQVCTGMVSGEIHCSADQLSCSCLSKTVR